MTDIYHKIQTVWLRDPAAKHKTLLEGQWSKPEFGWLAGNEWVWTEKVDGTNIRLILNGDLSHIEGKTDAATLHPHLIERCRDVIARALAAGIDGLTLYGEGYGAGIQKGGGNYRADKDFVLFDVCTPTGVWLERENVEGIAAQAGIGVVPIWGRGTLHEAIQQVRTVLTSHWSADVAFQAEGLVMRPAVELRNRFGERVITKLKRRDFA